MGPDHPDHPEPPEGGARPRLRVLAGGLSGGQPELEPGGPEPEGPELRGAKPGQPDQGPATTTAPAVWRAGLGSGLARPAHTEAGIEYAELHCHSALSLLDGANLPETLLDRARAEGLRALALTDHDDLGGVVRFARHAQGWASAGGPDFPALIGVELTVEGRTDAEARHHLTLLAEDATGHANLARLVTHARHRAPRGDPRVAPEVLAAHAAGVVCLSGCPRGEVSTRLAHGDRAGARATAGWLREVFGAERFAVEVGDHGLPEEARLAGALIELAGALGAPWVVTNNVHYARPEDRVVHDVLVALRTHTVVDAAGSRLRPNAEWHLKGPRALAQRWRHDLRGLHTSVALAERCAFRLGHLSPKLPALPVPPAFADADAWLAHLAWAGAARRWGEPLEPAQRQQVLRELKLIASRGLAGYFLIVWEIVEFARSRGILVQGRGSAANSSVCFCLGITAVDPIRHRLLFERFLSEARETYPDIDLDIAHARREEVIQFVYARYGQRHAAMVCEHVCFRGRSAVREAARALGFSVDEGGRLAEQVGREGVLDEGHLRAVGFAPEAPRVAALQRAVAGLQGLPRHRSIHVGGFVLSAQPVGEIVPVEPAAMEGRTIIQWDKDDLDAAGLPKFDLLGLGMLTALSEGLDLASAQRGLAAEAALGLYNLPDDPAVYDMIGRADTVGVFQIESRAQMNTLPRIQPRTLYELAIQVALIRPGPLQGDMVHPYIRRKRGEEAVEPMLPAVEPILGRTLGVPLFQEQGMQLAVAIADFTPVEADALRRAMGSERHRHKLSALSGKLRAGMARKGVDPVMAERVIAQIEAFSTYGFPESHSTSFALLVYASCWLKHHHPAAFLCALLNAQPLGFYAPAALVHDARRHGVKVLPPCLARSHWATRLEGEAVRLGLRLVAGLGSEAAEQWQAAVAPGPFTCLEDALARLCWPEAAWRTLAESGALEIFIRPRRAALWAVLQHLRHPGARGALPPPGHRRRARSSAAGSAMPPLAVQGLLPLGLPAEVAVALPSLNAIDRTRADYRTLGLTTGRHPCSHLRPALLRRGGVPAVALQTLPHNARVRLGGQVNTRQRPESAKGFFFLTLEDETGFVNVIVRPDDFERNRRVLVQSAFLWVEGVLAREQGVCTLKGRRFAPLVFEDLATPRAHSFR